MTATSLDRERFCPVCGTPLLPHQRVACSSVHASRAQRAVKRFAESARDPRYVLALLQREHPELARQLHMASEMNDPRQLGLAIGGPPAPEKGGPR
ncbi:MAG: hypothetical protein U1A78_41560 [Polyangia bacterium]